MQITFSVYLITGLLFFISFGCDRNHPVESPSIETSPIIEITSHTATGGGIVIDGGGNPVTGRGVVWATSEDPSIDFNEGMTYDGSGLGIFESEISGLTPGTTYYVRAYADNRTFINYGNQVSFTTLLESDGTVGTLEDIDGNTYKTVFIGGIEWMAENLIVSHYNNGEPILTNLDNDQWRSTNSGAYTIYTYDLIDDANSDSDVLNKYGALYNWHAVGTGNLCPAGWKVPDDVDWKLLEGYVDSHFNKEDPEWDRSGWRGHDAGQRLRSSHDFGFVIKSDMWFPVAGTNDFGFSALPAGFRSFTGPFFDHGNYGYWWSTTEVGEGLGWMRSMGIISVVRRDSPGKNHGFSVRCMREVLAGN